MSLCVSCSELSSAIADENDDSHESTTFSDDYSDSEYLYLDQEYESWSDILLSKSGDSFFVQSDGDLVKSMVYADVDNQNTAYVEFNEDQYPSLMLIDDYVFIFSNYRNGLVDITLINGDEEIGTFFNVEYNIDNFAISASTKATAIETVFGIKNVISSVASIAGASTTILASIAAAPLIGTGAAVVIGVSALTYASATAYSMIVDSYDLWVAPAPEDMVAVSDIIGIVSLKDKSDVIGFITEEGLIFLESMNDTIKEAQSQLDQNSDSAEYVIDITVGDIISSDYDSATCELQGILEVAPDNGEFDFNYGICYSINSTPTVADQTVFSSCVSNDFLSSISLTLPISMTMGNLDNETTYYYRAYFQDNITGEVVYSDPIKSFYFSIQNTASKIELITSIDSDLTIGESINVQFRTLYFNADNNEYLPIAETAVFFETEGNVNNPLLVSDESGEVSVEWTPLKESDILTAQIKNEDGDTIDEVTFSPSVENPERAILEQIYYATGGKSWYYNSNWCTDAPLSEWYGVTVSAETGAVTGLYMSRNNLTGDLDVSGLTSLITLSCDYNNLTVLDVSGCSSLSTLSCRSNQLLDLDVSECSSLSTLYCFSNQLTNLDVSGCSSLESLDCDSNQLTNLDVSGCSSLESLDCDSNQLTTLNVSGCSSLSTLSCCSNKLTTLDVSSCSSLKALGCDSNQLTTLNLSGCSSDFAFLSCYSNQLTTLDVSGYRNLWYLFCGSNQLTTLDASGCSSLGFLNCTTNNLVEIYLYSIPVDFYYKSWGDRDIDLYTEPYHKNGYQYPVFYYK